jgi:hypothetical protein
LDTLAYFAAFDSHVDSRADLLSAIPESARGHHTFGARFSLRRDSSFAVIHPSIWRFCRNGGTARGAAPIDSRAFAGAET